VDRRFTEHDRLGRRQPVEFTTRLPHSNTSATFPAASSGPTVFSIIQHQPSREIVGRHVNPALAGIDYDARRPRIGRPA